MYLSHTSEPTRLFSALALETYKTERNGSASNPGPQNIGLVKLNRNSEDDVDRNPRDDGHWPPLGVPDARRRKQ
jgi:hypothetical protein